MELFHIEKVNTHGGSLRVFIKNKSSNIEIDKSVDDQIKIEIERGLNTINPYLEFNSKITQRRKALIKTLNEIKNNNLKIAGYGAPAKATTLLNFFGIDNKILDYIIEDNELKHGREIPGTSIPIVSKAEIENNPPDFILILAWNFSKEIIDNNKNLLSKGIKFIELGEKITIHDGS